MTINVLIKLSVLVLLFAAAEIGGAQDMQTRSITSDDFAGQRPAKVKPKNGSRPPKAKIYKYKYIRTDRNVVRWGKKSQKSERPKPPVNIPIKVAEIGITMWKMRPPRKKEIGHLLPVEIGSETVMWLAERVSTNTIFRIGDRIRFAIESSDSGYLYVLDRETFSDGSFGEPTLLFPASQSDDNSIRPGMLFDIPDQRERDPNFKFELKNGGGTAWTGELITIIVSPKPLGIFKPDRHGYVKNSDELLAYESATEVEIFSRTDIDDRFYTESESQAACGEKTRGLAREKSSDNPCGNLSRQLTRDEAKPQSIYRVRTVTGQPSIAFVRLTVYP